VGGEGGPRDGGRRTGSKSRGRGRPDEHGWRIHFYSKPPHLAESLDFSQLLYSLLYLSELAPALESSQKQEGEHDSNVRRSPVTLDLPRLSPPLSSLLDLLALGPFRPLFSIVSLMHLSLHLSHPDVQVLTPSLPLTSISSGSLLRSQVVGRLLQGARLWTFIRTGFPTCSYCRTWRFRWCSLGCRWSS